MLRFTNTIADRKSLSLALSTGPGYPALLKDESLHRLPSSSPWLSSGLGLCYCSSEGRAREEVRGEMPQATQAPTDHSFQTLRRRTLATHKAWAGDMGGWGTWGGVSGSPPVSFRHNPGDYSLMCRIVDTRTHRLAPDGGTGAELTHPPTWDPYPGSLGCCAPLEDHGEAKDGSWSLLLSLPYPFPYTSRRTQCSFLCSPLPYPSSTLLPLHSSLKMVA